MECLKNYFSLFPIVMNFNVYKFAQSWRYLVINVSLSSRKSHRETKRNFFQRLLIKSHTQRMSFNCQKLDIYGHNMGTFHPQVQFISIFEETTSIVLRKLS